MKRGWSGRKKERERDRVRGERERKREGEIFIATIDCAQLNNDDSKSYMYFGSKIVEGQPFTML